MCGIAGFWSAHANPGELRRSVEQMLARQIHRGPDYGALWSAARNDLVLGHRRLAIIDLSPSGNQPMVSADGSLVVVFNGEIYNFRGLRRLLEEQGRVFASQSDTEILIQGYAQWGEAVLDRMVGMFAFAIWDAEREQLFLARDRLGEKPLYYAANGRGFAFASEVRCLASLGCFDTAIDQQALALYLAYQYVPSPHTIYRGLSKLPPAHAMRVKGGKLTLWRYWDPTRYALAPRLNLPEPVLQDQLEELLRQAVREQMIADVPLGAFLSGGIDSSMVVSLMAELSTQRVRTFTIGFELARYNEADHAEAVAQYLHTEHTTEYLTEADTLKLVTELPSMYGEPFADPSALPTHLVSRVARKQVTVSLSGDGGDEAFGGYPRYRNFEFFYPLAAVNAPLRGLVSPMLALLPGKFYRTASMIGESPQRMYQMVVGNFIAADVFDLLHDFPRFFQFEEIWQRLSSLPLRRRLMLADLVSYLPEGVLTKVDRAAMACSLETRAPILDHRVMEFALRLPLYCVRDKHLLKRVLFQRLPKKLLDRPKQGFGVPVAEWFRTKLRDALLDVVTARQMQALGIANFKPIERLLRDHLRGARDHSLELWSLFVLALWYDYNKS